MKLIDISYPYYKLVCDGVEFEVIASKCDKRLVFTPVVGWSELSAKLNRHPEGLLEDIDDCIYNGSPEVYE